MKYYLDTHICIYFLKGLVPLLLHKIFAHSPDGIKIASIVKAELLYGAQKSRKKDENLDKVNRFLLPYEIVPFDSKAAVRYSNCLSDYRREGCCDRNSFYFSH